MNTIKKLFAVSINLIIMLYHLSASCFDSVIVKHQCGSIKLLSCLDSVKEYEWLLVVQLLLGFIIFSYVL